MNREINITGMGFSVEACTELEDFWKRLNTSNTHSTHKEQNLVKETKHILDYEAEWLVMCVQAIHQAANDAGVEVTCSKGCVIVGSGMGLAESCLESEKLNMPNAARVKRRLIDMLKTQNVIVIANACSSGAQAITYGCDLIQTSRYSFVIAGGMEGKSTITSAGFQRLKSIDPNGCKPFDENRRGISVGSGAAFFVLQAEKRESAYCKISGYAVTNDAFHLVAPDAKGEQIKHAIRSALELANIVPDTVDAVVAHGTGTRLNDKVEAEALYSILGEIDVTAPKGRIGHTGGASGAFGLLTAIAMIKYQAIPPIISLRKLDVDIKIHAICERKKAKKLETVLVDTFAFGGTNVVIVCKKADYKRNDYVIRNEVCISQEQFEQVDFNPSMSRTMDPFTKKLLYTLLQLMNVVSDPINPERTGAVISTQSGALSSLENIAGLVKRGEAYKINPSLFPNVMLSTALYYLTSFLQIHGPSNVFVDDEIQGRDALEYAVIQMEQKHCDAMILVMLNEEGETRGKFMIRREVDNESCTD